MLNGNDDEKWKAIYMLKNSDFEEIKPYIPKVIDILKENKFARRIAFDLLLKVCKEKPEMLLDYVDRIKGLIGKGYESVYASLILSDLVQSYSDVVDEETVEKIVEALEFKEQREYILLSLSNICLVRPDLLKDKIPKLIELIKEGEGSVRWYSARVLINMISKKPEFLVEYREEIERIARDSKLKPSIRVVAMVVLNELLINLDLQ